jgi:hypothetical protein
MPIISPYDPRDLNMAFTGAFATVFRSASYAENENPGINGAPYRMLYENDLPGKMRRATSHQDEAFGRQVWSRGLHHAGSLWAY